MGDTGENGENGTAHEATHWVGRRAWLVGASSGIGAELAGELARRGAQVAITARRADRLQQVVEQVRARPKAAAAPWESPSAMVAVPADATDADAMASAAAEVRERLGGLDDVIWCAAHWQQMDAAHWDASVFARHIEVNLLGLNHLLAATLPQLVAQHHGRVVILASVAGYRGLAGSEAYGATKAAQLNLTESMRASLARHGVDVTAVCPGFVRTELTASNTFRMPFLMDADRAARIIADGLARDRPEISFPWQLALPLKAARLLPIRAWTALSARLAR